MQPTGILNLKGCKFRKGRVAVNKSYSMILILAVLCEYDIWLATFQRATCESKYDERERFIVVVTVESTITHLITLG